MFVDDTFDGAPWTVARAACQAKSGGLNPDLATIKNAEEAGK